MSPPVISSNMFVTVVKMLSTLCSSCPMMAVELLNLSKFHMHNFYYKWPMYMYVYMFMYIFMLLDIAESLKYLLIGSEEINLDNSVEVMLTCTHVSHVCVRVHVCLCIS